MGAIQDLLTEVPLSAVLKERVALADQKYERAKEEIEGYRGGLPLLSAMSKHFAPRFHRTVQTRWITMLSVRLFIYFERRKSMRAMLVTWLELLASNKVFCGTTSTSLPMVVLRACRVLRTDMCTG
jgi:hypothetical protein